MVLRDVLRQAILKLGLDKDIDIDKSIGAEDETKRLILSANNIIREIASSYLPLLCRESITIEDNRYDLTKLSHRIIKLIGLYVGDNYMRCKMYPTYMYAPNGVYDIVYSYLPDIIKIDGVIEIDPRINEDILSNGIVSEYALMDGNMELANIYNKKFSEAIRNLSVTSKEIRIKGRAFV